MRCADEDLRAWVQVLNAENQLLHTANAGFDQSGEGIGSSDVAENRSSMLSCDRKAIVSADGSFPDLNIRESGISERLSGERKIRKDESS